MNVEEVNNTQHTAIGERNRIFTYLLSVVGFVICCCFGLVSMMQYAPHPNSHLFRGLLIHMGAGSTFSSQSKRTKTHEIGTR